MNGFLASQKVLNRRIGIAALALTLATVAGLALQAGLARAADDGRGNAAQRPGDPGGPPDPGDHRGPGGPPDQNGRRPGPPEQRAMDGLNLTDDQKQKIDPMIEDFHQKQDKLREDLLKQMKDVLTPEQYEKFESNFKGPPRPPGDNNGGPRAAAPAAPPALPPDAPPGSVAITFTGGYETDVRDGGRPVVLIAAALNVPSEVFRKAFSNVIPAAGGQEPEPAQVGRNKATLMRSLSPYGITNDVLDKVSNYYRYSSTHGEMWRNTPAAAYATIANGVVTGITLTNPGAGYSSAPMIAISRLPDLKITATISYGTDFKTNGSIKQITIDAKKPSQPAVTAIAPATRPADDGAKQ